MGDRVLTPDEALYDERGRPVSTGARLQALTFVEEVHATFKAIAESLALAGCTLADVIDCQVWLRDPRDFHEFNRIYATYFQSNRPVRSVFRTDFMLTSGSKSKSWHTSRSRRPLVLWLTYPGCCGEDRNASSAPRTPARRDGHHPGHPMRPCFSPCAVSGDTP